MKNALSEVVKTAGRPVKRALQAMIDNRLVDYHMPPGMPGDLLLTFDDGPHPENTPRLLDILDAYEARALFFVIGAQAEKRPDLLREIEDRGHLVANHTFTHLDDVAGGRYSGDRVVQDITRCTDVVRQVIARPTRQFRPPRGELNTKTWGAARKTSHRLMLWSIEGGEWGRRSEWSAEAIAAYVRENIRRRDILLMHDDSEKTLVVMQDLLPRLRAQGFDLSSAVESLR